MDNNKKSIDKKNLSKEASIKEKARKSIVPPTRTHKKRISTSTNGSTTSFEDVPKRSEIRGLPSKEKKVFDSKASTNSKSSNKKSISNTSKEGVKNKSISASKSESKKVEDKTNATTKKKSISNNTSTNTKKLNSNQQKSTTNSKEDKSSSKTIAKVNSENKRNNTNKKNTQQKHIEKNTAQSKKKNNNSTKDLQTKNNSKNTKSNGSNKKNNNQNTPKKKTTIKTSNKKDEKRPNSRENSRPTKRTPKQKALQSTPIVTNKKKKYISNNKRKKVSNANKDENFQINKFKNIIEKNKKKSSSEVISINRKRTRELTKKQLENNAKRIKVHNSIFYKLFNSLPKFSLPIKLIYLLSIIIILVAFVTVNYVFKEYDIFPNNDKLEALQNKVVNVEVVKDLEDSSKELIESTTEIISPIIDTSNSVLNYDEIRESEDFQKIIINSGLSATQIASLLDENGICDKDEFLNFVISNDLASNLRSGEYYIAKDSSVEEIVNSIIESDPSIIIIYPAKTIDQIDQLLTTKGLINRNEFDNACTNLCMDKGFDFVEGWFAPATYKITNEFDVNLLASAMLDSTMAIISPYTKTIAQNGYSINDIIIIASLIQGETQDVEQMPIISSVIHNRLKEDMPLGIDATTRYELGDWTNELTAEQMNENTPYNTRRQKGLPPSGICLSSKEAIISAIFPKDTNYLYYIHGKEGELIPALTYEEHLSNIEKRDNI